MVPSIIKLFYKLYRWQNQIFQNEKNYKLITFSNITIFYFEKKYSFLRMSLICGQKTSNSLEILWIA